ncbi:MAG: aminoacetone oxidase family FAD-binding enzyme [Alphaproteobacteria bacterium]|nr:aminoacetone oxidase family FAD-binding enzyme [Alphaproteobacteria bacterium]MBQ8729186.1 aminoacetone oxidase family FAD-binding enzyme [Alphaproteobacteria bacterium]
MKQYDVIIIGAGAAGLSAAAVATARGRRVAVFDMGDAPARKVQLSGGGNCNITNMAAGRDRYFGQNPDFVRGALSRVSPTDILAWAQGHNLQPFEKGTGRYFCAAGADAVVRALMQDAETADFYWNTKITNIKKENELFYVNQYCARSVIVATGGISFDRLGVSDAGYQIAKSVGHKIVPVRPALCALALAGFTNELAGISLDAKITIGRNVVRDSLLFTHVGIGGPATYRASLYDLDDGIKINLMPDIDACELLRDAKRTQGRKSVVGILSEHMPARAAKWIADDDNRNIADIKDADIAQFANNVNNLYFARDQIKYHSMHSAEVVRGGVAVDAVSSKTMESKLCSGLFLVGEVLDIAGDLGGFNLQWAWASGRVAGENA